MMEAVEAEALPQINADEHRSNPKPLKRRRSPHQANIGLAGDPDRGTEEAEDESHSSENAKKDKAPGGGQR
jgi:hypothetical protein